MFPHFSALEMFGDAHNIHTCSSWDITYLLDRNPDANERPFYPDIINDLTAEDALVWSEEDKQIAGASATVLGNPLTDGYKLYIDLQSIYKE